MNKIFSLLLICLLCICSCSKDDDINIDDFVMPTETNVPWTNIIVPIQLRSESDIPEPIMSCFNQMKEESFPTLMFEGTNASDTVYMIHNQIYGTPNRVFDPEGNVIRYEFWPYYAVEWNWICIYVYYPDRYKEFYLRYN